MPGLDKFKERMIEEQKNPGDKKSIKLYNLNSQEIISSSLINPEVETLLK